MKITEKMLLDGYTGKTNGFHNISNLQKADGTTERVLWIYRRENSDGIGACICGHARADRITLEGNRWATLDIDKANAEHPSLGKIESDENKICGDEI